MNKELEEIKRKEFYRGLIHGIMYLCEKADMPELSEIVDIIMEEVVEDIIKETKKLWEKEQCY